GEESDQRAALAQDRQPRGGVRIPAGRWEAAEEPGGAGAHPQAGDPARVDGRGDLARPRGQGAGDGDRQGRAQAVPLQRRVHRQALHPQVPQAAGPGALHPPPARSHGRAPGARGRGAGARAGDGGEADDARRLPRGERALRHREQDLRARHPAQEPPARGGRQPRLPLPRQKGHPPAPGGGRHAAGGGDAGDPGAARPPPLQVPGRRRPGAPRDGARRQRVHQGDPGEALHLQGPAHLGRHRARRHRAGRAGAPQERHGSEEERPPRLQARLGRPGEHAGRVPQLVHPSRRVRALRARADHRAADAQRGAPRRGEPAGALLRGRSRAHALSGAPLV
ncbi:MAG: DNA topoisomerase IB (poxvirus type), partial [uncultured Gemmatimonadetes bacterium]